MSMASKLLREGTILSKVPNIIRATLRRVRNPHPLSQHSSSQSSFSNLMMLSSRITTLLLITIAVICQPTTSVRITRTDDPPPRFVTKKFKTISGKRMAYVEVGEGDPIVFLHGNPTSSYLWRNIMPHLEGRGRLIAPDLIGMGDSDKLDFSGPNRYTFLEHSNFLFQLLEALRVKEKVTLVIHDWGSALGFLWAYYNRFNPNAVKGIVFFEAFVAPFESFADLDPFIGESFSVLRSPAGEKVVLEDNFFVEEALPSGILRNLTMKEMDEYRRPFLNPGEDRRPTLTWPRQIPFGGEPADVAQIMSTYSEWLARSKIPKLFIKGEPGVLLVGRFVELVRTWPEITEVSVRGIHFLQEDSFNEIGKAIAKWLPM